MVMVIIKCHLWADDVWQAAFVGRKRQLEELPRLQFACLQVFDLIFTTIIIMTIIIMIIVLMIIVMIIIVLMIIIVADIHLPSIKYFFRNCFPLSPTCLIIFTCLWLKICCCWPRLSKGSPTKQEPCLFGNGPNSNSTTPMDNAQIESFFSVGLL